MHPKPKLLIMSISIATLLTIVVVTFVAKVGRYVHRAAAIIQATTTSEYKNTKNRSKWPNYR